MDDTPDYLAWRAFYLGLRIADNATPTTEHLQGYVRQLDEIAAGNTTLHNSAADIAIMPSLSPLFAKSTNQVVLADRELAQAILRGLDAASTTPD